MEERSEVALNIANRIANLFVKGFCNDKMVDDFARMVDEGIEAKQCMLPLGGYQPFKVTVKNQKPPKEKVLDKIQTALYKKCFHQSWDTPPVIKVEDVLKIIGKYIRE